LEAKQRIMGTLTINPNHSASSAFFQKFPEVKIVTGLLIRREFYRKLAVSSLGNLLRETFTCLQWLRHEAWHGVDPQEQSWFEKSTLKIAPLQGVVVRRQMHVGNTVTNLLLQITRACFHRNYRVLCGNCTYSRISIEFSTRNDLLSLQILLWAKPSQSPAVSSRICLPPSL
jgi:hypothetical protein